MDQKHWAEAEQNLRRFWGYDSFRPGQREAIESVMDGRDTLVLFPTGGGKSLCYQLPATMLEGLTLVISPLVALMQDQVEQLKEKEVAATYLNSTLSSWEIEQRLVNARNGMYRLLYCAPERLESTLWEAESKNLHIAMVAIDEAHCISEWGHDFRPSYRKIRAALASVPESTRWMALTATATPEVRDDILASLAFEEPAVISRGFQRPNLKWWVVTGVQKDRNLFRTLQKAAAQGPGLVYGGTRKNCERLAEAITRKLDIKASAYHAGVDDAQRKKIQQRWIAGDLPLVVATTAFGMGIDKADCRYVVHYQPAYSLEAYYQQAGRAGRDGAESYPILFSQPADIHRARQRINDAYPTYKQLQKVYDGLCDALHLAVGSQEDAPQEISVEALKKRTNLRAQTVETALKTLDRLNIIALQEHTIPRVGVRFVVNPEYLRTHIRDEKNQLKAHFMDVLFRQLGGAAFSEMNYVDRDFLQRKLDVSENALMKGLQVLQNHDQILQFKSLGALPLVRPVEARMRSLPVGRKQLEKHRDTLLQKLDYMAGYIETDTCREVYIRNYFGEQGVQPCGHCDNCLQKEKVEHGTPSSGSLQAVKKALADEKLTLTEIKKMTPLSSRTIQRTLSYLRREQHVVLEGDTYRWND